MAEPIVNPAEKRRSRRFVFVSPVEAAWQEADGKIFREAGRATEVNAHGALLQLKAWAAVGSQMELTNLVSHETLQARVVAVRRDRAGHLLGIAVEFLVPNETFWGANFQIKKTHDELVKLEYYMRTGAIDPRILREFRDAVDHVRKTAWALEEWQQSQAQRRDSNTVLSLLTAERIRRATQLCDAVTAAWATHEVTLETAGIGEFFRAVQRAHQCLELSMDGKG
jgi:hypothetical protein